MANAPGVGRLVLVLEGGEQRRPPAIVLVEGERADALGDRSAVDVEEVRVLEEGIAARRRDPQACLARCAVERRAPEAWPHQRERAVRPVGRIDGGRGRAPGGIWIHEGVRHGQAGQVEGRQPQVVPAGAVLREGEPVPGGRHVGGEGAAEHVGHAQQRAVRETEGVEVRDAVAVGAKHDRVASGAPRRLHVLGAIVRERSDGARRGVDEHHVQPAARPPARRHDRVAPRAPAWPAPLHAGLGGGEVAQAGAVEADGGELTAADVLVDEHHPAAVRRHVWLAGPRAARQAAHLSAGHLHHPEVGVLREDPVGLGLVENEHPAAGGP